MEFIAFAVLSAFFLNSANASERVLTRGALDREGYIQYRAPRPAQNAQTIEEKAHFGYPAHSLPWPARFEDRFHWIGNAIAQFQDYGEGPYFHAGVDLRVKRGESAYSPVAGRLEAGHYSYGQNPDGSLVKYWKPWPQTGESLYFEVAVVDDHGTRFEFHHVDRDQLPVEIVNRLNSGQNARVEQGQLLGKAVFWPNSDTDRTLYHHFHYNIVRADGVRINPEWASVALEDRVAPQIKNVYARRSQSARAYKVAQNERLSERPFELIVEASDALGQTIYPQTPARVQLIAGSSRVGWDFVEALTTATGWPDIREVFALRFLTSTGERLQTAGNYSERRFFFRVPISSDFRGQVTLEVGDTVGNEARWALELP